MKKRAERRYSTEKVIEKRYRYYTRNSGTALHCPRGRYRKWNGSCACASCQWAKIGDIAYQRMKDLRRNLLPEQV